MKLTRALSKLARATTELVVVYRECMDLERRRLKRAFKAKAHAEPAIAAANPPQPAKDPKLDPSSPAFDPEAYERTLDEELAAEFPEQAPNMQTRMAPSAASAVPTHPLESAIKNAQKPENKDAVECLMLAGLKLEISDTSVAQHIVINGEGFKREAASTRWLPWPDHPMARLAKALNDRSPNCIPGANTSTELHNSVADLIVNMLKEEQS